MISTMGDEPRVCGTRELNRAIREAERLELNDQLHENTVAALDPHGHHVMSMVLWGRNVDTAPVLYHRLSVLLKVRDSMAPVCMYMDVTDTWWQRQLTHTQHKAATEAAEREARRSREVRERDGF